MHRSAMVDLAGHQALTGLDGSRCQLVLTTEDPPFAPDAMPPGVTLAGRAPRIHFDRPSAVLLLAWPAAGA